MAGPRRARHFMSNISFFNRNATPEEADRGVMMNPRMAAGNKNLIKFFQWLNGSNLAEQQ
jgi:hypothetical protein